MWMFCCLYFLIARWLKKKNLNRKARLAAESTLTTLGTATHWCKRHRGLNELRSGGACLSSDADWAQRGSLRLLLLFSFVSIITRSVCVFWIAAFPCASALPPHLSPSSVRSSWQRGRTTMMLGWDSPGSPSTPSGAGRVSSSGGARYLQAPVEALFCVMDLLPLLLESRILWSVYNAQIRGRFLRNPIWNSTVRRNAQRWVPYAQKTRGAHCAPLSVGESPQCNQLNFSSLLRLALHIITCRLK